jgi:hypothetical protein
MRERPFHEKVIDLASLTMALIYVGGGVYLIFSSSSFRFLPFDNTQRYALAGILILYGCYRAYRVWRRRSNQDEP